MQIPGVKEKAESECVSHPFGVARHRFLRIEKVRGKTGKLMIAMAISAFVTALPAVANVLTFSWTGGLWNDGGSVSGTFTVEIDSNGMPTSLVSADVVTGDGTSDGFLGQSYIYDVSDLTSTIDYYDIDATQYDGAPANELQMIDDSGYRIFLDWQGTDPTSLWVGDVGEGGQYTSENDPSYSIVRYLTDPGSGSSETSDTPEPAGFVLAGLGLMGFCLFPRRKA